MSCFALAACLFGIRKVTGANTQSWHRPIVGKGLPMLVRSKGLGRSLTAKLPALVGCFGLQVDVWSKVADVGGSLTAKLPEDELVRWVGCVEQGG